MLVKKLRYLMTKLYLLLKLYLKLSLSDPGYLKPLLVLVLAIVTLIVFYFLIVLPDFYIALLYIPILVFILPGPLHSLLMYPLLRSIYSSGFDTNMEYYVKLDIYIQKCFWKGVVFNKFNVIALVLLISLFIFSQFFITIWSIKALTIIFNLLFIVFGLQFGYIRAKIYKSMLLDRRDCRESSELPKDVKDAINILGLSNDPRKFFSDTKASIGLSTLIAIVLGYVAIFLAHGLKGFSFGSFEGFLQKSIELSFLSNNNNEALKQYGLELLFISLFYIFPFTLTIDYYVFVVQTLRYLRRWNISSQLDIRLSQLKRSLLVEISYDVAIPFVSIFLKSMWRGGIPSEFTNLYTFIPAILMTFSMGPITYFLKLVVELLLQHLSRDHSPH